MSRSKLSKQKLLDFTGSLILNAKGFGWQRMALEGGAEGQMVILSHKVVIFPLTGLFLSFLPLAGLFVPLYQPPRSGIFITWYVYRDLKSLVFILKLKSLFTETKTELWLQSILQRWDVYNGEGMGSQVPTWSLSRSWLAVLFHFSGLQFPHYQNGDNDNYVTK